MTEAPSGKKVTLSALRRRVLEIDRGEDPPQAAALGPVGRHAARGFGGEAKAPVRALQRVVDLGLDLPTWMDAAADPTTSPEAAQTAQTARRESRQSRQPPKSASANPTP